MPQESDRYNRTSNAARKVGSAYASSGRGSSGGGGILNTIGNAAQMVRDSLYSAQFVPNQRDNRTLSDIYGDRWGSGGGGGGGGGGGDPYAAQRAAEERRRAAMRAAIEKQFGGAIAGLNTSNLGAAQGLNNYYHQAGARLNPIYNQNQKLTQGYGRQLADVARNSTKGVISEGDMLARDLQGQGAGLGDLRQFIGSNVEDMLGARAAGDQYNTRLAQVMGTSKADNFALLSDILHGAQSTRTNNYTQQLNQLRAEQAMRLAELA